MSGNLVMFLKINVAYKGQIFLLFSREIATMMVKSLRQGLFCFALDKGGVCGCRWTRWSRCMRPC